MKSTKWFFFVNVHYFLNLYHLNFCLEVMNLIPFNHKFYRALMNTIVPKSISIVNVLILQDQETCGPECKGKQLNIFFPNVKVNS